MTDECVTKFREEIIDRLDMVYNNIQDNDPDKAIAEIDELIKFIKKAQEE